jgi:MoxR-like ATPase
LEILLETRIINTENELIAALKNTSFDSKRAVSIDGVDGVGKTTLSKKIAQEQ